MSKDFQPERGVIIDPSIGPKKKGAIIGPITAILVKGEDQIPFKNSGLPSRIPPGKIIIGVPKEKVKAKAGGTKEEVFQIPVHGRKTPELRGGFY